MHPATPVSQKEIVASPSRLTSAYTIISFTAQAIPKLPGAGHGQDHKQSKSTGIEEKSRAETLK